jgi:Flp pilus assembly protein TadB
VIVRLVLLAGELRRRKLQVVATMAVAGAGIAAAGVAVASGTAEILAVGGGVAAASAGWWSARAGYQRTLVRASEALERFLDALQHRERRGSTPPPGA